MQRNLVENLEKKEFEASKIWIEACDYINKQKIKDFKIP